MTRQETNEARLKEMWPAFAVKVRAVIKDLEAHGYKPRVQTGWRSPAEQLDKYKKGYSKLKYGFHNVTAKDGTKQSFAFDITEDKPDPWNTTVKAFWLMLASSALAHGLESGAFWGLSKADRNSLQYAINNKNWAYKGRLGFDVAHAEVDLGVGGLTRLKLGWRPKSL